MKTWTSAVLNICALIFLAGPVMGEVHVGDTRASVISALGEPKGASRGGGREILAYSQGRVVVENGKVISSTIGELPNDSADSSNGKVDSAKLTENNRPSPAASHARWLTDFKAAKAEATANNKVILALFTGSDWCPACMQFEAQVAHSPEFLTAVENRFVLLKLDYPHDTPQSPALQAQNEALMARYKAPYFPALMILNADGENPVLVEAAINGTESLKEQYIRCLAQGDAVKGGAKKSLWRWLAVVGGCSGAFLVFRRFTR